MKRRHPYQSDLSDAEWRLLEPLIPAVKSGGRPAKYERRAVVNAILYVLRSGCSWRMLPHHYLPWETVYGYFSRWCQSGVWQQVHEQFRERLRLQQGRQPCPSAGAIDSQSVKTTEKGAQRLGCLQAGEGT